MNRIEVTYTEDDFFNAICFMTFRLATTQKNIRKSQFYVTGLMLLIGLLALVACHFAFGTKDWFSPINVIGVSAGLVMSTVFFFRCPKDMRKDMCKNIRKQVRETFSDNIDKPCAIELRDEGIHSENHRGQSVLHYSAVTEIIEHENVVYVSFDKASVHIFPRDRIPKETLDAFVAELKTRVSQSQKAQAG